MLFCKEDFYRKIESNEKDTLCNIMRVLNSNNDVYIGIFL